MYTCHKANKAQQIYSALSSLRLLMQINPAWPLLISIRIAHAKSCFYHVLHPPSDRDLPSWRGRLPVLSLWFLYRHVSAQSAAGESNASDTGLDEGG